MPLRLARVGPVRIRPRRQAWLSAWPISSGGCAPEIPYRRSITKNGTPVAPRACARLLVGGHVGTELVGAEHGRDLGRIEPDFDGQPGQGSAVEHRILLGEVRAVQPLDQLGLPPVLPGQLQQPVCVPGVAAAQVTHPERQASLRGALLHLLLGAPRLVGLIPYLLASNSTVGVVASAGAVGSSSNER